MIRQVLDGHADATADDPHVLRRVRRHPRCHRRRHRRPRRRCRRRLGRGLPLADGAADAFDQVGYPNEIGPVWDTHSPRVPSIDEVDDLLTRAIAVLGADRLWASPDCGLKTRGWPEVEAALANLVAAALRSRRRLAPLPA